MTSKRVELVYFDGCPNADRARQNIRAALEAAGAAARWTEWDLASEATPGRYGRYASPTVLVDGNDVTGDGAHAAAMSCRADGAPSVAAIAERLGP